MNQLIVLMITFIFLMSFYRLTVIIYRLIYTSTLKIYEFSTRVGTIVDLKKVLKQAGVVSNIKSQ